MFIDLTVFKADPFLSLITIGGGIYVIILLLIIVYQSIKLFFR